MARHARLVAIVSAFAVAALLSACGSSGNGASNASSSGSAGSSADAGVTTAKTLLDKYNKPPESIGITTKVSGTIPSGKTVAFMNCGSPACGTLEQSFEAAAKVLGWNVQNINQGATPEAVTNAWKQVERNLPDAVVSTSQPVSAFQSSLQVLTEKSIPVVDCCSLNEPQGALKVSTDSLQQVKLASDLQAASVIVDSGGKGKALFIATPQFPSLVQAQNEFGSYLSANCSTCSSDHVDVAAADLSSGAIPTKVVGYLRSHPDVKYVISGFDDEFAALPAAIKQAGLTGVKLIGKNPTATSIGYLKAGDEAYALTFPGQESMWLLADALARTFAGGDVSPDKVDLPVQVITGKDVNDSTTPPTIPNYQEQFKQLWGK